MGGASKITCFLCHHRTSPNFGEGIEIDLNSVFGRINFVFVWGIEIGCVDRIDLFFVRGVEIDVVRCAGRKSLGFSAWGEMNLFSVVGSKLTCFLCAGRKWVAFSVEIG